MAFMTFFNAVSRFIVFVALVLLAVGYLLMFSPAADLLMHAVFGAFILGIISIPFSIASLVLAYHFGVISLNYLILTVLLSLFILPVWLVVPFVLKKDINLFLSEVRSGASA
jgi:hypothetical protein